MTRSRRCGLAKVVILLQAADMNSTPEVASLAVRLAQDPENAAALGEGELFDRVMEQAFERLDSLCFKVGTRLRYFAHQGVAAIAKTYKRSRLMAVGAKHKRAHRGQHAIPEVR